MIYRCRFWFCGRSEHRGLCLLACVCSALEVGISAVDEINSDVLCPSVIVDNEDGEVIVVDNIVSAVDPLSPVEDSNVDILVGDIAAVNVD